MAEAFGAAVTSTKGTAGCTLTEAGANVPHPPRRSPVSTIVYKRRFMGYGETVKGVFVAVCVDEGVMVKVDVGETVEVGGSVVAVGVDVSVDVGKSGMVVVPGTGVRVDTFGTQSLWPA